MKKLQNVRGVVWDLDGTLYRYNDRFIRSCSEAAARAACAVRPTYSYEEALEHCLRSEAEYGFSLYWFHQETGMGMEDIHFVYHDALDETIIAGDEAIAAAVRTLDRPSVILTNASRGWARRILKHIGMDDVFADSALLALEDTGYAAKGRSLNGFAQAVDLLGMAPEDVLIVEDLPRNLANAKKARLQTALVHYGVTHDPAPEGVDHFYHDALELLKDF